MRSFRVAGFALVAGVGLGVAGAHAAGDPPQATTAVAPTASSAPAEDRAASELREHHRHHHHGGVTKFIAMSLDTLGADEAKRPQIEKLQAALHAAMAPARDAEKDLLATVADDVAAGKKDAAKVDAATARLTAATHAAHDASLDALNQLHAILSPAERAALVDKVQAHWEVWRQVNEDAPGAGHEHGGRLAALAKDLGLTPSQVSKISAALDSARAGGPGPFDPKLVEGHVQAFSSAFVGESFDAKSLAGSANDAVATHGATRMVRFYETVAPLLTNEQRTKLAEQLREHASYVPVASGK